ncbi:MAG: GNAT family N-acetyltransferase [Paracoccus sp. (in: a-proteobacteria)]|uniref:GNAT family N-acetyltransferase n=1 Tax=Paracoccus sp. TaxID=267 RepID=UPI00391E04F1
MITLTPTPVLDTDRLTLRAPQGSDWPHWRSFHQSDRARYIGGGPDLAPGTSWRAFGHVIGHWAMRGFGMFVFTLKGDDTPLGLTGPWFPDGWPEQELGWTVWTAGAEGRGLVSEAARAARLHAFTTLGWTTAVSYIDPGNARSIALAERLGATLDTGAAQPKWDKPCLVYRHPAEVTP